MKNLDINVHNHYSISIMDLSHDLDISDMKWDLLINYLLENSEGAYFYGLRLNYLNDDLKQNIQYLTEQGQFREENEFNRVMSLCHTLIYCKMLQTYL